MEFTVPAVGFVRIAGIQFNAADGVVETAEKGRRHADEFADVEVRNVHLHLNLRGEMLRPHGVHRHAALRRPIDNAHLGEHRKGFSYLVARNVEAFGDFRLGVNAAARLRLTKNVLVNIAKERLCHH